MAQACETCGGTGYGFMDEEVGWRSGSPRGQDPVPCPDCKGRFDAYAKSAEAKLQYIDVQAGNKKVPRNTELTFGSYVDPSKIKVKTKTIQAVDSDGRNLSDDAFDPGVVETGNAKVSIEEALAATAAEAGEE